MPKTTKKVATKKTVAKKAPAKKSAPVAKVAPVAVETPAPCCCGGHCHCGRGKKIIVLVCALIVGFLISQLFFCGGCHHKRAPQPVHFVNGCVDVASVKCPKMLEDLSKMDADHDGCITKVEMRAAKKATRHHHKKPAQVAEPAVVDAIAPVME